MISHLFNILAIIIISFIFYRKLKRRRPYKRKAICLSGIDGLIQKGKTILFVSNRENLYSFHKSIFVWNFEVEQFLKEKFPYGIYEYYMMKHTHYNARLDRVDPIDATTELKDHLADLEKIYKKYA